MRGDDDAAVVERSLTDTAAFADLYDRHARAVFGYVARRAGREVADDLVGETFLVAYEGRHRFDLTADSARPWLLGIATNLLRRQARSEARRWAALTRVRHLQVAEGHDELDLADARLDAAARGRAVAQAVSRLTEGDRDVLLLVAWGDLSYPEVAAALDIPVGTVRSRLHRARRLLRDALDVDLPADPRDTESLDRP